MDRNTWNHITVCKQTIVIIKQGWLLETIMCINYLFGLVLWHINQCRLVNVKSIFIHIKSSIRSTQFSSIWPIDRTLSDATTPGQGGPESDDNKGVLCIPQTFSITGASPSDCLVSYTGHSLGESYPSAEKQSVYSTAPSPSRQGQNYLY